VVLILNRAFYILKSLWLRPVRMGPMCSERRVARSGNVDVSPFFCTDDCRRA
jgi:hypothetical protein